MYDELVKRLRCQLYGNCPECVNWYTEEVEPNLWRERCMAIDAADAIEEMQRCIDGIDADNDSLCEQLRKSEADNINLTGWLAEEHARHQWISVEDRLPEENGDYIVYCIGGNYNQTSCISLAYWGGLHFYVDSFLTVTHWMNLPEPPKEIEA